MKLLSMILPILVGLSLNIQQITAGQQIASELLENNNKDAAERSLTLIQLPPSGILAPSPAPPRPGNVGDFCFTLLGCDNGLICEFTSDDSFVGAGAGQFSTVACLEPSNPDDPDKLPRNVGDICNPQFGCDNFMVCDIHRTEQTISANGTISVDVSNRCTNNACLFETRTKMEQAHPAYDDSDVTKRSASNTTNDGNTVLLLDDFSTNDLNNFAYRLECEDAGGDYVELHYTADCTTSDREQSATIFVAGQPRCYSSSDCQKASDEQSLFEEFTLVPTEERADIETADNTWHCRGTLLGINNDTFPDFCQTETEILNQQNALRVAERAVPPIVSTEKFFFGFFDIAEKLVQFSSDESDSFDAVCKSNGGLVAEIPEREIVVCGDASFRVEGFSACLWPLCDPGDETVIAALFQARMATADGFQNIQDCTMSSVMRMSVSSTFAVVGAVVWYLGFL